MCMVIILMNFQNFLSLPEITSAILDTKIIQNENESVNSSQKQSNLKNLQVHNFILGRIVSRWVQNVKS